MKKYYKFLIIAIMVIFAITAFVACDDKKDTVKTSLATPQNLGANGSTISWDAVEGASSYEIIVDEGEAKTTSEIYYRLDISAIGTYQIKVRAVGKNEKDETIYSEFAQYTFVKSKKLAKPTVNVDTDAKVATWGAVENAASYLVVTKTSSGEVIYNDYQDTLSFSFDNDKYTNVGKYTIQVKAIPEATKTEYANSDAGVGIYIITKKLSAPAIATVNSTAITWTAVSGSVAYELQVYKIGDSGAQWPKKYQTTSNSYAFSSMGLEGYGKYYCLLRAIGDGQVYITSDLSERAENFDLNNIETIDADQVEFVYNTSTKKWEVSFDTENADLLASFTITLKTTKADNSSSMPTLQETLWVKDGTFEFTLYDGEYNDSKTYYTKTELGSVDGYFYEKNTKPYDQNLEYCTFDGQDYTKVSTSYLENSVEYYVKRTPNYGTAYYAKAIGEAHYTEVAEGTVFDTKNDYYVEDGGVYTLIKSGYMEVGTREHLDPADLTTKYFSRSGDVYTYEGRYADLASKDPAIVYYVYKPFTSFVSGTTYYVATYADFNKVEFDKNPTIYYTVSKASFTKAIDDIFFTVNGDEYTYKKSDIAYYGKNYTISITADAIDSTTITGDDIVVDGEYTSYRKPIYIDKDVDYANSKIKGYFVSGTEEENIAAYQAFANAHNGWYAVDSIGALQYMAYETDKNYVIMQDLDAEGYYWKPIKTFTGILDGNNHKIENIVYAPIEEHNVYYEGLIASLIDGQIRNLYILNASNKAEAGAMVGGIVAETYKNSSAPVVENCYVNGTFTNASVIGGIVGDGQYVKIKNCQSDVTIRNAFYSAAIVANLAKGDATNCIALGEISVEETYVSVGDFKSLNSKKYDVDWAVYKYENDTYTKLGSFADRLTDAFKQTDGTYYSEYFVKLFDDSRLSSLDELTSTGIYGGLIGYMDESDSVTNSSADVKITINYPAMKSVVGGFIAVVNSGASIENCYAGNQYSNDASKRMDLVVSSNATAVGGFVGANSGATIKNCYSTIRVSASDNFGGFVGYANGGSFVRCYTTGGIGKQTGDHKGAFVAIDKSATYTNCYVYDRFNDQAKDDHAEEKTLEEMITLFKEADAGSYATIEGYLEPCAIGPIYAEAFKDTIKASEELDINAYYINYDAQDGAKVINIVQNDEDVDRIYIGDITTKGSALIVIQEKANTQRRIVIYVTVS